MRLTMKYTLTDTEPAEASRRPSRPPTKPPTELPTVPTVLPTASVRLPSSASRNGASSKAWPTHGQDQAAQKIQPFLASARSLAQVRSVPPACRLVKDCRWKDEAPRALHPRQ